MFAYLDWPPLQCTGSASTLKDMLFCLSVLDTYFFYIHLFARSSMHIQAYTCIHTHTCIHTFVYKIELSHDNCISKSALGAGFRVCSRSICCWPGAAWWVCGSSSLNASNKDFYCLQLNINWCSDIDLARHAWTCGNIAWVRDWIYTYVNLGEV